MISRRLAQLGHAIKATNASSRDIAGLYQMALHSELDRLQADSRYADLKCLIRHGRKSYSQCDEDGIIAEIFNRIGATNKRFVEFGVGTGLENNTLTLLFSGWSGLWIDADSKCIGRIKSSYAPVIKAGRLCVVESFITKDNIDELIRSNVAPGEIDLLSVDLDGNDFHILCAITSVQPRVVVVEYNAKFAPPIQFCMEYDQSHSWQGGDCFGASLKFLEIKLRERGYSLVGCNLTGANAFFVRNDLVAGKFLEPFSAELHYQPARYYLTEMASGHPASYDTLAKAIGG